MATVDSVKRGIMPRSPRSFVVSLAALMLSFCVASVAQAHRAAVVGRGDSIQAAVDAASPATRSWCSARTARTWRSRPTG